jgi:sortase A
MLRHQLQWRRHVGLLVVLGAVLAALTVAWYAGANTLPAPGWSVTPLTPVANLQDGSRVTINVKANSDVHISELVIRECRLDVTYTVAADMDLNTGKCPAQALSTSADLAIVRNASANGLITLSQSDEGATISFNVGVGVANWSTPGGPQTLTCDPSNPCALVVRLRVDGVYTFWTTKLTFTDADPIKACGGTAPGALNTGGSDELVDAWSTWTRQFCAASGTAAPTRAAFSGESSALSAFSSGDYDIAYSGAGYDSTVGLADPSLGTRGFVAVPVALNAAVVATGGGYRQVVDGLPIGDKAPYAQSDLRARDAATLLGGGIRQFQRTDLPYSSEVLALNPTLRGIPYWTGANVQAAAIAAMSTYTMTDYLTTLAPSDWLDRTVDPAAPRGITASLATATPNFLSTALFTGRPTLAKTTTPAAVTDPDGPLWVFTDRATALALGLQPAALANQAGAFVSPDTDSMDAAVSTMKADPQGFLLPNVTATAADVSGTGVSAKAAATPYPLTYVVYAIAPTEQLVDPSTCAARSDSQKLLTSWLTYLTGPGQTTLPAGLEQLPPALATKAVAAIAKVGASPVTGKCAGSVTSATGGAGSASPVVSGSSAGASGSTGGSSVPSSFSGVPNGAAATATAATGAASAAQSKNAAVAIPAFAGHTLPDQLGSIVALVGIVLIMSLAAWTTAGGGSGSGASAGPSSQPLTPRRFAGLGVLWASVTICGLGLVLFQLGPLLEQRDQRSLLSDYRQKVKNAANETQGLGGVTVPTQPPEIGAPVGIIEVGALKTQDVVIEGASPSTTREGPGHVPGTSGLGQPGNSVLVARRNGYGGPFAGVGSLRPDDRIVVTTTQGQSVYSVTRLVHASITDGSGSTSTNPYSTSGASAATPTSTSTPKSSTTRSSTTTSSTTAPKGQAAPATAQDAAAVKSVAKSSAATSAAGNAGRELHVSVDKLYGPTSDDRLTLVTSANRSPWNSSEATVVVAKLVTKPFAPTPQGARSSSQTGMGGDTDAWPAVALAVLALVGAIVASILLYRKLRFRIAYVLTIAPLVALTIVAGDAIARLLPAWT